MNEIIQEENKNPDNLLLLSALDKYYELKNRYEEDYKKVKLKIMKNDNLSLKEKRIEIQKNIPKCINCKRPVGSIFKIKKKENEIVKTLISKCGDTKNPCPFDIEIDLNFSENIENINKEYKNELKNYEIDIIKYKNDLLFNYIKTEDVVEKFETLKEEINETTDLYHFYTEKLLNITDNQEKENKIKEISIVLYDNINTFKNFIQSYQKTNELKYLENAVVLNVKTIQSNFRELSKLKYKEKGVYYDESNNTYHLFEIKNGIDDFEQFNSGNEGVIKFVIGNKNKTGIKTNKNRKEPNNKTKKITIVEDDSYE
jgi:hypothetical protein